MARYDLINTKYCQMAFQSPSDGALISPIQQSFEIPGQTKVSGDRQRKTTHEPCCLAAEVSILLTLTVIKKRLTFNSISILSI